MQISKEIENIIPEIRSWRHTLHAHPELGYEEKWTSDFVADKLQSFGIEVHKGLGGTGVVGVLKGLDAHLGGGGNKAIGLRADMDALPMTEENDFPYKSKFDGRMHACGHDGHTAMLLGAAKLLASRNNFNGTVYFIFQPLKKVVVVAWQ